MLERLAAQPRVEPRPQQAPTPSSNATTGPRRLSVFELARLRREVHGVTGRDDAPEVVRQVVWSIEEGALRRFSTLHALHIALKKIREGAWTRPNRMPPNWMRVMATPTSSPTRTHARSPRDLQERITKKEDLFGDLKMQRNRAWRPVSSD